MEQEAPIFDFIYKYVEREVVTKYLRLAMCLSVYLMMRGIYLKWAMNKQLKQQVSKDEAEKAEKPEVLRKEKEEVERKLVEDEQVFGWGKKTRSTEKRKQAVIDLFAEEERQRNQDVYDVQEDSDIDDLLEDD